MNTFDALASGLYLEGLAVDYTNNAVWYSDVVGGGIHQRMPDGSVQSFNQNRMWTGGIMLNKDGSALSSGQGGIMWTNPETGRSDWLINSIDGKPISGINEMSPDGFGGIYFGTSDLDNIVQGQMPNPSKIYRLSKTGELSLALKKIDFSNGLMLSSDGKKIYCNNTFHCCYAYDVTETGLTNERILSDKTDCDGLALDTEGNLWITGCRSSQILRIRPDGSPLENFDTPAGAVTQIRFGGKDMRDIYINAVSLESVKKLKSGEPLTSKDSLLYRTRSNIAGARIAYAEFDLK